MYLLNLVVFSNCDDICDIITQNYEFNKLL